MKFPGIIDALTLHQDVAYPLDVRGAGEGQEAHIDLFPETVFPGIAERVCDIGTLRQTYAKEDGSLGYRCPAEPVSSYEQKGGDPADYEGVVCLCNCLGATAGFPRRRKNGYIELPLVTAGDMLEDIGCFLPAGATHYRAEDVLRVILEPPESTVRASA